MYKTHVKTCKKKLNEIKDFERTPKMRVGIDGDDVNSHCLIVLQMRK